jgi:hypothetical protein
MITIPGTLLYLTKTMLIYCNTNSRDSNNYHNNHKHKIDDEINDKNINNRSTLRLITSTIKKIIMIIMKIITIMMIIVLMKIRILTLIMNIIRNFLVIIRTVIIELIPILCNDTMSPIIPLFLIQIVMSYDV